MSVPEVTLRRQAVWHLWARRRVRIEEVARLFGVTPRTICRDLAALKARGWHRRKVKDALPALSLDLLVEAHAGVKAEIHLIYTELAIRNWLPRSLELFERLHEARQAESMLALAAQQLTRAVQGAEDAEEAEEALSAEEAEALRQELTEALAVLLAE